MVGFWESDCYAGLGLQSFKCGPGGLFSLGELGSKLPGQLKAALPGLETHHVPYVHLVLGGTSGTSGPGKPWPLEPGVSWKGSSLGASRRRCSPMAWTPGSRQSSQCR